jgi:hypothetical protein
MPCRRSRTGEVYDYFDGTDDLLARRVRFIGERWSELPRTTCASCAFSASTPALERGHRIQTRWQPALPARTTHGVVARAHR